jgi:(p)ppGpp synthase/HD superfamily hydrolase
VCVLLLVVVSPDASPACAGPLPASWAPAPVAARCGQRAVAQARMTAARRFPSFVDDLPITCRALEFAAEQHHGQRREADHAPFILHPLEVAQLLRGCDYPDPVVAAGVLHDVIEDTDVDSAELERRFGAQVAALVTAVSEPLGGGDYPERKARLRDAIAAADADAAAVFAADKVAKARELRMSLARDPGHLDADKLEHYWASLALLEHRLGHHPLVRQLRFELETLELLPPSRVR